MAVKRQTGKAHFCCIVPRTDLDRSGGNLRVKSSHITPRYVQRVLKGCISAFNISFDFCSQVSSEHILTRRGQSKNHLGRQAWYSTVRAREQQTVSYFDSNWHWIHACLPAFFVCSWLETDPQLGLAVVKRWLRHRRLTIGPADC
jgi:hypothetical protein